MDSRIFNEQPMGLRAELLRVPLAQRFGYDAQQEVFFANFEGLTVRSNAEVEKIRAVLVERLTSLERKVPAIVDNDNFHVLPEAEDAYFDMVRVVSEAHYSRVTRYTTSAFMRSKLGEALGQRQVAPHVFESAEEARRHLAVLARAKGES